MKVIFLDIDGVLNSRVFFEAKSRSRRNRFKRFYKITINKIYKFFGIKHKKLTFDGKFRILVENTCEQKWKWLVEFCNTNDYKICISSCWKNHFDYSNITNNLKQWKMAFKLLGFKDDIFVGTTIGRQSLRGDEIKSWLDSNPTEAYAIIDDDMDMLEEQMTYFYHVDQWFGLTPNILYRIKYRLK